MLPVKEGHPVHSTEEITQLAYIDRVTKQRCIEQVYGQEGLLFLYGYSPFGRRFGHWVLPWTAKLPLFSSLYGWWARQRFTRKRTLSFIEQYKVDLADYEVPRGGFATFNDFFGRPLKSGARPMPADEAAAIIPADGRYRCFPCISEAEGFFVKGRRFSLSALLQDKELARHYEGGTMVIGRLCPTDYHRFHFPCGGRAGTPRQINGYLYSVNPLAIRKNIDIFTENKRVITAIESKLFGRILFIEVGATVVGTIHQTFKPDSVVERGEEKGLFSFGGSAVIVLFEPGRLVLDADLVRTDYTEVRCLMGQTLGHANGADRGQACEN